METSRIAELLQPFVAEPLSDSQLHSISAHLDLLLRWNARMNLTAVRDKDNIVTRHFGESLFAARQLFPAPTQPAGQHLIDIGSGAGFPGLPIKLWNPALKTTLIESNHKKATFLREVVRSLSLGDVEVLPIRSEDYKGAPADVVTLRAVERFEFALPTAATLVRLKGEIALLIGEAQSAVATKLLPSFLWRAPSAIPQSDHRILLVGSPPEPDE